MRMFERCAVPSFNICWRSSRLNSDFDFCGFRMTATMTTSKWRAVRSMMSRWPRVTGSKDPGQRAVATHVLLSGRRVRRLDEDHERIPELPFPAASEPFGQRHPGSYRALDTDRRAGCQPSRFGQPFDERLDVCGGRVV